MIATIWPLRTAIPITRIEPRRDWFSPSVADASGAELAAAAQQLAFDGSLAVAGHFRDFGVGQSGGVQADDPPLAIGHPGSGDGPAGGKQLELELRTSPLGDGLHAVVIVTTNGERGGSSGALVELDRLAGRGAQQPPVKVLAIGLVAQQ